LNYPCILGIALDFDLSSKKMKESGKNGKMGSSLVAQRRAGNKNTLFPPLRAGAAAPD